MAKVIIIIIAIILLVAGLAMFIYSIWRNWKISQINSWPKVDATVINVLTKVEDRGSDVYVDAGNITVENANKMRFKPTVMYVYQVNGKEYQSNKLVYSQPETFNAAQTKYLVGELAPGSTISVYVNPKNPGESYIYNGISNYWGIIAGIIIFVVGLIVYSRAHVKKDKYKDLDKLTEKYGVNIILPQYRMM